MDKKMNVLALYVVARQRGIPIPTDLKVELINNGLTQEHVRQALILDDRVNFVRGCLLATDEEIEADTELSDTDKHFVYAIRELLTPETRDALEEEIEEDERANGEESQ